MAEKIFYDASDLWPYPRELDDDSVFYDNGLDVDEPSFFFSKPLEARLRGLEATPRHRRAGVIITDIETPELDDRSGSESIDESQEHPDVVLPPQIEEVEERNAQPTPEDGLQKALEAVAVHSTDKSESNREQLRHVETHIAQLQADLENDKATHAALQARIKFLLTKDAEELDTEGALTMRHRWLPSEWTPDFVFHVTSKHPIRKVLVEEKSKKSEWIDFPDPEYLENNTIYSFTSRLQNKRFGSAKVTVRLLGWRREIHIAEIKEKRDAISKQERTMAQLDMEINKYNVISSNVLEQAHSYEEHLSDALEDICRLQDGEASKSMQDSSYRRALLYGLKTKIKDGESLPSYIRTKIEDCRSGAVIRLIRETEQDLREYSRKCIEVRNAQRGDCEKLEREASNTFRNVFGSVKLPAGRFFNLDKGISNESRKAFEALEQKYSSVMKNQFEELEAMKLNCAENQEELWNTENGPEKLLEDMSMDIQKTDQVFPLMSKRELPIGIAAVFFENEKASDAWISLWHDLKSV